MNVFVNKVKRKLQLDGIGEFKAPKSKCIRPSCIANYSSYTGKPMGWYIYELSSKPGWDAKSIFSISDIWLFRNN